VTGLLARTLPYLSIDTLAHSHPHSPPLLYFPRKGDYHRYLAQFAPEEAAGVGAGSHFPATKAVEMDCALSAYKIASALCAEHLRPRHPLRVRVDKMGGWSEQSHWHQRADRWYHLEAATCPAYSATPRVSRVPICVPHHVTLAPPPPP